MKKFFALLLVTILFLGFITPTVFAADTALEMEVDVREPGLELVPGPDPETNPEPGPEPETETHLAYMRGDDHGNFRPRDNVTRAEVAAILVRTQVPEFTPGELPPGMEVFDTFAFDVGPDDWFYYYVAWAYYKELIVGSVPTEEHPYRRYRPTDLMRRDEVAAVLVRTLEEPPTLGDLSGIYIDWDEGLNWSRPYIYTAYQYGWMMGNESYFRPWNPISRAEVATVINRMLGRVDSRAALDNVEIENPELVRVFPDVNEGAWYYAPILAAANDHEVRRDEDGSVRCMLFF